MNEIIKDAELNSIELVERRDQIIREKQNFRSTLNCVAPYRTKRDANIQIVLCEKRIKELNQEIERRAIVLKEQNKNKGATNAV